MDEAGFQPEVVDDRQIEIFGVLDLVADESARRVIDTAPSEKSKSDALSGNKVSRWLLVTVTILAQLAAEATAHEIDHSLEELARSASVVGDGEVLRSSLSCGDAKIKARELTRSSKPAMGSFGTG